MSAQLKNTGECGSSSGTSRRGSRAADARRPELLGALLVVHRDDHPANPGNHAFRG
jgi:hypothetical protein